MCNAHYKVNKHFKGTSTIFDKINKMCWKGMHAYEEKNSKNIISKYSFTVPDDLTIVG